MGTDKEKLSKQIREILEKNEDAVKGYEKAAEISESEKITKYFNKKAKERLSFIAALRGCFPELDLGNELVEGSDAGTFHRSWMSVKAFFAGDSDEAMLEEAINGDKAALEEYETLIDEILLPAPAAKIILQQMTWIKRDLEEVKSIEEVK